jgi:hypothetical protein
VLHIEAESLGDGRRCGDVVMDDGDQRLAWISDQAQVIAALAPVQHGSAGWLLLGLALLATVPATR